MKVSRELEQKILELAGVKHDPEKFVDEKAFQAAVEELAGTLAWKYYHPRNSRGSKEGYPDLTMTRGRRVIFAELKTEEGEQTADQKNWGEVLAGVGGNVEYYLWKPSDWIKIEKILD